MLKYSKLKQKHRFESEKLGDRAEKADKTRLILSQTR